MAKNREKETVKQQPCLRQKTANKICQQNDIENYSKLFTNFSVMMSPLRKETERVYSSRISFSGFIEQPFNSASSSSSVIMYFKMKHVFSKLKLHKNDKIQYKLLVIPFQISTL